MPDSVLFWEWSEEELSHYDMFSILLLMVSITVSRESLIYLRSPPLFSLEQSDRVEAGLGEEAVLHCQVSSVSPGITDMFMGVLCIPVLFCLS